jgi:hypothetical protein
MKAKNTKTPKIQTWTAGEALSWGMFGDETILTASSLVGGGISLPAQQRTYDTARRELRDAIAEETVEARGFENNIRKPSLARETLLPDLFQKHSALAVDASGETTFMHPASPQNIPQWNGIVFLEKEIRALWPKPMPDLDKWMMHSVTTRPDEKRDSRISDCKKATGCSVREAKAAYDRLPPNLKRGRGQRIKAATSAK